MVQATTASERPLSLQRLQLLSDIVFASSMTLMVMLIDFPDPDVVVSDGQIADFLVDQLPAVAVYGITFVMIAIYWMKHVEHFSYYQRTSQALLWLQLLFLATLAILPFSSGFSALYPDAFAVQIFYSANLFLIGALSCLSWTHATRNHRLVDARLDDKVIATIGGQALVEPTVALLAMGVAWLSPALWELTFILVPVLFALRKRFRRQREGPAA